MERYTIVRIAGVAFILPLVVITVLHLRRARKIYHDRQPQQDTPPILKLLGALVLGLSWGISSVFPRPTAWQTIGGHIALAYCLLLTYSANKHVLTGQPHHLKRSALTLSTTTLAGSILLFGYLSRDNLAHPFAGRPFIPTLVYFVYYSLVDGTLILLFTLILTLYWQSMRQSDDLTYQARRAVGVVSIMFGIGALVTVEVSIVLSIVHGTTYHFLMVLYYCLLPGITLFPIAQALPQPLVVKAVQPLERYRATYRETALRYLHQRMLQIVPGEQLVGETFDLVDALTEISGARRIIWSQEAHAGVVTATEEARHLFDLLEHKHVIETAGKYRPPHTATPDIIKHNMAVATYLRKLEARNSAQRRLIYDTGR